MLKDNLSFSFYLVIVVTIVIVILFLLIAMITFQYQKQQIALDLELKETKANFEKELMQSQIEIQQITLNEISQEIHDNIGQKISMAKLFVNTINLADLDELSYRILQSSMLLTEVMDEIRQLSRTMDTTHIKTHGLVYAIQRNLLQIEKAGKISVVLNISESFAQVGEKEEFVVYRIFQEIITNIIKHSKATQINVNIQSNDNRFILNVTDNGVGISPFDKDSEESLSSGIRNMKKRATLVKGHLEILGSNNGTSITIIVPLSSNEM